jgi:hypothetical protein
VGPDRRRPSDFMGGLSSPLRVLRMDRQTDHPRLWGVFAPRTPAVGSSCGVRDGAWSHFRRSDDRPSLLESKVRQSDAPRSGNARGEHPQGSQEQETRSLQVALPERSREGQEGSLLEVSDLRARNAETFSVASWRTNGRGFGLPPEATHSLSEGSRVHPREHTIEGRISVLQGMSSLAREGSLRSLEGAA